MEKLTPALPPNVLKAARALAVDGVTAEVVSAFRAAGIPSILLKGPSIARWLYPTGGRTYGDSDLLVPPASYDAAEKVLRQLGFVHIMDGWAPTEYRRDETARTYVRRNGARPGTVDLHQTLHQLPGAGEVVWDTLSARAGTLVVAGVEVAVPDRTTLALHIVLHVVHHAQGHHTSEDLRRLIAVLSTERWAEVAALAATLGLEDELALGLRLDPAGEGVAQSLGLAACTVETSPSWAAFAPSGAIALADLSAAATLGERLRRVRWTVLPSPAKLRYVLRLELETRRALVAAYCAWWRRLARTAVPALRHVADRQRRLKAGG